MNAARFWEFIDQRAIVRRIMLVWMAWMTSYAFLWTVSFASDSPRPGVEVAAIIAAVWLPLTGLQGAVFAFYSTARSRSMEIKHG